MSKQLIFSSGKAECTLFIDGDTFIILEIGEDLKADSIYYTLDLKKAKVLRDELRECWDKSSLRLSLSGCSYSFSKEVVIDDDQGAKCRLIYNNIENLVKLNIQFIYDIEYNYSCDLDCSDSKDFADELNRLINKIECKLDIF